MKTIQLLFTCALIVISSISLKSQVITGDEFKHSTTNWSLRNSGENLQIYETEQSKEWARFDDDWGLRLTGTPNLQINGDFFINTDKRICIGTNNASSGELQINNSSGSYNTFADIVGNLYFRSGAGGTNNGAILGIQDNKTVTINVWEAYDNSNFDTQGAKLYVNGNTTVVGELKCSNIATTGNISGSGSFIGSGKLYLEAGSGNYVEAKSRSSSYGLILREYNSSDYGNIEITSKGLGLGYNTSSAHLTIAPDGNVGVGTVEPSAKLSVDGKILAEEIEVVSDITSDFVFEEDYELRPLSEVEKFVKENKHLPEIPSMQEFAEQGQNLGEMQDLLLRKIEELTLYVIELEKQVSKLKVNTIPNE